MRKVRTGIVALVLAGAVVGAVFLACTSSPKSSPERILAEFMADADEYAVAVKSGNAAAYAAVWDENGVQMLPGVPAVIGRDQIEAGMAGYFAMFEVDMVVEPQGMIVTGDYIITHANFTRTSTPVDGGEPLVYNGKTLAVWRRDASGHWKLVYDCFNSNEP